LRKLLVWIAALLAAIGAVAPASAANHSYSTSAQAPGVIGPALSTEVVAGRIASSSFKCIESRSVELYSDPAHTQLEDTGYTSHNGFYAVEGNLVPHNGGYIVVRKAVYGKRGHRTICKAASTVTGPIA
jgi:hypothetical protein